MIIQKKYIVIVPSLSSADKNPLCPYRLYGRCLDFAYVQGWRAWSCALCPFRKAQEEHEEIDNLAHLLFVAAVCRPDVFKGWIRRYGQKVTDAYRELAEAPYKISL